MSTSNFIQAFAPELDAVVLSPFVFAGQAYDAGQPFPHKVLGADKMSLNGLWLAGLIRFVQPPAIDPARIDALGEAIREGRGDGNATAFDAALDELLAIARGTFVAAPPAPIVYKEDPADEPDPEVLKAQIAATKAKVKGIKSAPAP